MFDLLGQLLPAAGSIAGGMVEGQKLADDRARMMQVMALAKAQEERAAAMHPLEMRGMDLLNQNRALPLRKPQGDLQGQVAGLFGVNTSDLGGSTQPELMDMLQAGRQQEESTRRANIMAGSRQSDDFLQWLKTMSGAVDQPVNQARMQLDSVQRRIKDLYTALHNARSTERAKLEDEIFTLEKITLPALQLEADQLEGTQRSVKDEVLQSGSARYGTDYVPFNINQEPAPSTFGRPVKR